MYHIFNMGIYIHLKSFEQIQYNLTPSSENTKYILEDLHCNTGEF